MTLVRSRNVAEDEPINNSLDDVIVLLEREIERLQMSLETIRLSNHPDRVALIRWHIGTLDDRQDALDQVKALLIAAASSPPSPDSIR